MGSSESEQDRYRRDTLEPQMQQLRDSMPQLFNYFQQQRGNVLGSYKGFTPMSGDSLNKYFDTANTNLTQNMNSQVAQTSQQAGALAASRRLANPSGFVGNQSQNVRTAFNPQFGELQGKRFGALADLERYNNMGLNTSNKDYTNLLMQLSQMGGQAMQGDFGNQQNLFGAYNQMGQYYDPYSSKEKNTQLGGQLIGYGAQAAGSYYGGGGA